MTSKHLARVMIGQAFSYTQTGTLLEAFEKRILQLYSKGKWDVSDTPAVLYSFAVLDPDAAARLVCLCDEPSLIDTVDRGVRDYANRLRFYELRTKPYGVELTHALKAKIAEKAEVELNTGGTRSRLEEDVRNLLIELKKHVGPHGERITKIDTNQWLHGCISVDFKVTLQNSRGDIRQMIIFTDGTDYHYVGTPNSTDDICHLSGPDIAQRELLESLGYSVLRIASDDFQRTTNGHAYLREAIWPGSYSGFPAHPGQKSKEIAA